MTIDLSSQGLSTAAGALVSVILMLSPLIPKLRDWWNAASDAQKQAVNILVIAAIGLGAGLLSCFAGFDFMECSRAGWLDLVGNMVYAMIGNAGAFVTLHRLGKAATSRLEQRLYG